MPIDADCTRKQFALLAPGRTMMCQYYSTLGMYYFARRAGPFVEEVHI